MKNTGKHLFSYCTLCLQISVTIQWGPRLCSVYGCMHEGREKTNLHMRQNNTDWLIIILD